MKRLLISFLLVISATSILLSLLNPPLASAWFGPNSGDKCSVLGERKNIDGKQHICGNSSSGQSKWLVNTNPTEKNSALGLVLQNCGSTFDGKYSVYIFPRMMFGAVLQKTIEAGDWSPPKKSSALYDYDITRSQRITSNFEMASTLDNKWTAIRNYWKDGIDSAYRKWNSGGGTQLEVVINSQSYLDSIESICKVAFKSGQKSADKEKRKFSDWLTRVTKGY